MINKKDILRKANKLFIEVEGSSSDDDKIFYYRVIRYALPRINDDDSGDVILDSFKHALLYEKISPIQLEAIFKYFTPDPYPTYKALAEELETSLSNAKTILKAAIWNLFKAQSEYYIPAIKAIKEKEYKLYLNHFSIFDLGLSKQAENRLLKAHIQGSDLAVMTEEEIRKVQMIGPKLANEIIEKRDHFFATH